MHPIGYVPTINLDFVWREDEEIPGKATAIAKLHINGRSMVVQAIRVEEGKVDGRSYLEAVNGHCFAELGAVQCLSSYDMVPQTTIRDLPVDTGWIIFCVPE